MLNKGELKMSCNLIWMVSALAVAACAPATGIGNDVAITDTNAVALTATTALSLAELAYNSGESAATAALRSGVLTPAQVAALGDAIHRARSCRDQVREAAAAGADTAMAIEALDSALADITILAKPALQ